MRLKYLVLAFLVLATPVLAQQGLINPGVTSPGGTCASCTLSDPTLSGAVSVTGTATFSNTVNLSPANKQITISPTGTGVVTIAPATLGTLDNMTIGASTAGAANFTSIGATTRGTALFTTLGANGNVSLSPTGSVTINPSTASTIDNEVIGGSTPLAGHFTTLGATGNISFSPTGTITINPSTASTMDNVSIGVSTPKPGNFTTIGATSAGSGAFTTVTATGSGTFGTSSTNNISFAGSSTNPTVNSTSNTPIQFNSEPIFTLGMVATGVQSIDPASSVSIDFNTGGGNGRLNVYGPSGGNYSTFSFNTRDSAGAGGSEFFHASAAANPLITLGGNISNAFTIQGGTSPALSTNGGNMTISSTGGATTFSDASPTFSNITTGTAADVLCLTSGKIMILQAAGSCTISSIRFKRDIAPLTPASGLREILRLRPVAFNMREDPNNPNPDSNFPKRQLGLTAENIAAVDPRLALYEPDGQTPKSYRPEAIIATLVAAIQAQQAQINTLTQRLAASPAIPGLH